MSRECTNDKMQESQRELQRLLQWIVGHHDDWEHICDPDFFTLTVGEKLELIRCLKDAGLLSVAYVVLHTGGNRSRGMEVARDQIIHEIIAEVPIERLMEKIERNLTKAAEQIL
ncbi:hypothetical protein V1224_10445 [Lachnospiraceae bacterium JLR.KK008]